MDLQSHQNFEQRVGIIEVLDADRQSNTWHHITFDVPFAEDKKVVIMPMVQTYNGFETPSLRIQNVNRLGFDIRIDEIIGTQNNLSDGIHVPEVVGWIAYGFAPVTANQLPQLDYESRLAEAAYTPAVEEAAYIPASGEAAFIPASEEATYSNSTSEQATFIPASGEAAFIPASAEATYSNSTSEQATFIPASAEAAYTPASAEATYNNSTSEPAAYIPALGEAAYTPASEEPTYNSGEYIYTRAPEEAAYIPATGEAAYIPATEEAIHTSEQTGYYTANIWQAEDTTAFAEPTYSASIWVAA